MTTGSDGAANRPEGTGGQPLSSSSAGASADELRVEFQAQGRQGLAEERRRDARQARGIYAAIAGLVAVVCLGLMVVRLGQGDALGVWVATYSVGVALGGWGVVLARTGHTRWAMMVACIGGALAAVGDSPAFR
ncbi:hypothetical protein [Streptomyces sp. NBC_00443]|uniref:hypothetical protein n=1 Tax=Streptomyces sp. NBC_00443 TaxID=2975743 RepID=UPI002E1BB24E